MQRRDFLTTSLAASALALTNRAEAQSTQPREFYQLRKYHLRSGPQLKLAETYMSQSLIPALNRMGVAPVGAFTLTFGPDTPALYLLMPSTSVETLATIDLKLAQDAAFTAAAEAFWAAPASAPAFIRVESSLMAAFEGWPRLTPPPTTATHAKRIFQLRTYESPSYAAHVRKVEMFHKGEFDFFKNAGCSQVFFGDTLIGTNLPQLTYMLSFPDENTLNTDWDIFRNDPGWKKLSASPRYAYEPIVSNISNLLLTPTPYSQI